MPRRRLIPRPSLLKTLSPFLCLPSFPRRRAASRRASLRCDSAIDSAAVRTERSCSCGSIAGSYSSDVGSSIPLLIG